MNIMFNELLTRAKEDDKDAGTELLRAAWKRARRNGSGELRIDIDHVVGGLYDIAKAGKVVPNDLRDKAEADDEAAALKLFDLAWNVAHEAHKSEQLRFLLRELEALHAIAITP